MSYVPWPFGQLGFVKQTHPHKYATGELKKDNRIIRKQVQKNLNKKDYDELYRTAITHVLFVGVIDRLTCA